MSMTQSDYTILSRVVLHPKNVESIKITYLFISIFSINPRYKPRFRTDRILRLRRGNPWYLRRKLYARTTVQKTLITIISLLLIIDTHTRRAIKLKYRISRISCLKCVYIIR